MKTSISADGLLRIAKKMSKKVAGGQQIDGPVFDNPVAGIYQFSEKRNNGKLIDWYLVPAQESRNSDGETLMGSGIIMKFGDDIDDYASTTIGVTANANEIELEALNNPAFNLTPEDEEIINSRNPTHLQFDEVWN